MAIKSKTLKDVYIDISMSSGIGKKIAEAVSKAVEAEIARAIPYLSSKTGIDAENLSAAFNSYGENQEEKMEKVEKAADKIVEKIPASKCVKPVKSEDGSVKACDKRSTKAVNGKPYCEPHISSAVNAAEKEKATAPAKETPKEKAKPAPKEKTAPKKVEKVEKVAAASVEEKKPATQSDTLNVEELASGLKYVKMPAGTKPPIKLAYDMKNKGVYGIVGQDTKTVSPLQPDQITFAKSKKLKVLEDGPGLVKPKLTTSKVQTKPSKKPIPEEPSLDEKQDEETSPGAEADVGEDDEESPTLDEEDGEAEAEGGATTETKVEDEEGEGEEDDDADADSGGDAEEVDDE